VITGILLIQAVAFAVLSGIVANNKNRDPVKWGIIGLLFGLFGFIAVIAVSTVKNEKKCPACAEHIKVEARVCKHCGYEFSDEEVERRIAEAGEDSNRKKSFSYKDLDVYSHISNIFSFLVSVLIVLFIAFSAYDGISSASSVSSLSKKDYIGLLLSFLFISIGLAFAYSIFSLYTSQAFGIYLVSLFSPFLILFLLIIGIRELYEAYLYSYFNFADILIYTLVCILPFSIYYTHKKSHVLLENESIKKEYTNNSFREKISGLSDYVVSLRVNEIIFYTTLAVYVITPFVDYITS
jgi:hypothetical protein